MPPELQNLGPTVVSLSGWDILYHSERLNRSAWSNQPVAHETIKLRELCRKAKPQIIVELGGRYGGTTLALQDAAPDAEIFAFDRLFQEGGDMLVDWQRDVAGKGYLGYEDTQYHPVRSWFGPKAHFINLNFSTQAEEVKRRVDEYRNGPLFLFVDGDWGAKHVDMLPYLEWLWPEDVLAINNSHDVMHPNHAGNEWNLPDVEAILLPKGFKRFEFEWCEEAGMMLTRAWRKT